MLSIATAAQHPPPPPHHLLPPPPSLPSASLALLKAYDVTSPHGEPLCVGARLGQYEQHSLVQLVDCVGVIVECGADTARVLTSGGRPDRPEIRTVRLPDIKKRAGSRNAVTNDLSLQPVPPLPLPLLPLTHTQRHGA